MTRILVAAICTLALLLPGRVQAGGARVADVSPRCNTNVTSDIETRVRDLDGHPPSTPDLEKRLWQLSELFDELAQEDEILQNVCAADAAKDETHAYLLSTEAWVMVQQADATGRLYSSQCPAAAKAVPAWLLASAWYNASRALPEAGPPPKSTSDAAERVRSRAPAVGLTLPRPADASAYWRDQLRDKAQAALKTCSK